MVESIYWKGRLVGYLREPSVDMFELYGQWEPAPEDPCQAILAAITKHAVSVVVNDPLASTPCGVVEMVPDHEITI
jgi:hypothetical protein